MSNTPGATFLAIDVGTGSLKAAVTESGGKLLSTASAPVPYLPVDEDAPFSRAFDVEALWPAIVDVARRALRDAGVRNDSVGAVGVTSQRQGIGALDADGKELFLGPNMDLRALFEGFAIDEEHADTVYRLTGHLPSFMLAPAKLRWRKLYEPESYERIAAVVTVGDWVGYRLTGELAMQETLASEAGLLDISSGTLAASLLETLGLRTDCFPPITPTGEVIGRPDERRRGAAWVVAGRARGGRRAGHAVRPAGDGRGVAGRHRRRGGLECDGTVGHRRSAAGRGSPYVGGSPCRARLLGRRGQRGRRRQRVPVAAGAAGGRRGRRFRTHGGAGRRGPSGRRGGPGAARPCAAGPVQAEVASRRTAVSRAGRLQRRRPREAGPGRAGERGLRRARSYGPARRGHEARRRTGSPWAAA